MTAAVADVADVAVVGGGPAGAATAIGLRRCGVERVVLVEAGDHASVRVGESVPPDTRGVLRELGLLASFLQQGHLPSQGSCSSWGSEVLGHHDAIVSPYGHGWHLDRRRFDRWLVAEAAAQGVEVHLRTRFRGLRRGSPDRAIRLTVTADGTGDGAGERTIACRFVVDATGRRSVVARRLGARRRVETSLVCVAGWLDGTEWASSLTMLEAVAYGWWYLARLPDAGVAVVVASDGAGVRERGLADPSGWSRALSATRHVGPTVAQGRLRGPSVRVSVAPVGLLDPPAGPGWLAVGDAAMSHDPVTSRGVHTALVDGVRAARVIRRWLDGDPGAVAAHREELAKRFIDHLRQRELLYALEGRWPASRFWQRQDPQGRVPRTRVPLNSAH